MTNSPSTWALVHPGMKVSNRPDTGVSSELELSALPNPVGQMTSCSALRAP